MIGKGSATELFQLGKEKVRIYKKLISGSVGDSNGTLTGFYEFWEYKRYPWWQKIISSLSSNVLSPLPVPLFRAAEDAGVKDPQSIFWPKKAIEHYRLLDPDVLQNMKTYLIEEYWVKNQIISLMNARLSPHYEVRDYFGLLRLMPRTDQAQQDDLREGGVYSQSLKAILEVSKELDIAFKKRRPEPNKK